MKKTTHIIMIVFSCIIVCIAFSLTRCTSDKESKPAAKEDIIARGEYLVKFGGCNDCHSPKIFTANGPEDDTTRLLSGHPADMPAPAIDTALVAPGRFVLCTQDLTVWYGPWGISFPINLTPDTATGTGAWTDELFIKAMRTGKHLGSESARSILPPMPWYTLASLTDEDLKAILAYLHSIKPISNQVPEPVPPTEMGKKAGI